MNEDQIKLFDNSEKCCGCEACVNICPAHAISMNTDEYGIEYPIINHDRCIKCGLCQKVCQYKNTLIKNRNINSYAASAKDNSILMSTASGGIFTTIASAFIKNGGIVYGASMYDEEKLISPKLIRVTDLQGLELLKGSKYVQCAVGKTYSEAKTDLDNGKKVLFSGTPCQIAGLRLFLQKEYENLFTIDIICHGVPGKKLFLDFLKNVGDKNKGYVNEYVFRDKSKGQGQTARINISKSDENCEIVTNGKLLSYFGLFLKQEIYRDSCYSCLHTSCDRNGDITLGDYWGIYIEHGNEVAAANLSNTKGISCVLVNSEKGKHLIKTIRENVNLLDSTFEKISKHNDQLREPSKYTEIRKQVFDIYKDKGYDAVDNFYEKLIGIKRYLYMIEFIMPKELKRSIKTFAYKFKKGN